MRPAYAGSLALKGRTYERSARTWSREAQGSIIGALQVTIRDSVQEPVLKAIVTG